MEAVNSAISLLRDPKLGMGVESGANRRAADASLTTWVDHF